MVVKSGFVTLAMVALAFVSLIVIFWAAASSDNIYSYLGEQYSSYQKEQDQKWLSGEISAFDSRAVSTISLSSNLKLKTKKEAEREQERATQELLVNEMKSSLSTTLSKQNLHNHMKKARLIVTKQSKKYSLDSSCKGANIEKVLNNTSLSGEHYVKSLKKKRRITDGYKEIQEDVFSAMMNESCRIYKGRYSESQIALISLMATNTLIQAETN